GHHVEYDVVARAGDPEPEVMLGSRHRVALRPDQRLVESNDVTRDVTTCHGAPQLGPEPADEVDAAHGRPRLAEVGHGPDQVQLDNPRQPIQLEVRVRPGPEGEDPRLRDWHDPQSLRHRNGRSKLTPMAADLDERLWPVAFAYLDSVGARDGPGSWPLALPAREC